MENSAFVLCKCGETVNEVRLKDHFRSKHRIGRPRKPKVNKSIIKQNLYIYHFKTTVYSVDHLHKYQRVDPMVGFEMLVPSVGDYCADTNIIVKRIEEINNKVSIKNLINPC